MKHFKTAIVLLLAVMTVNCHRDNNEEFNTNTTPKVTPQNLKKFTLEKTEIEVIKGKLARIEITSGNGDYNINQSKESQKVAILNISNDKKYIEIVGISEASTRTSITDTKTNTTIYLTISVVKDKIPHEKPLSLLNLKSTDKQSFINLTNGFIKEYESIKKEIDKYPELPDSYKNQKEAYKLSLDIVPNRINTFKNYNKNTDIEELRKIHQEIYVYGVGYARTELLYRRAVNYKKQFPNNKELAELVTKMTSGVYATQEGNDFVNGFNNETIKEFNQIIDIVNKLNKVN